ncbi:hypothetical protein CC78DRAFT_89284 [Lojkania enalia]|uniref:RING-type domain-containing protein n=1 Tax=Lojkania enalia TaxID=147567 RepID=A0A9P4MYW3_9PLEO|nr:hypothetical protein CC78DRAFT_89284 [Didymosphaeria enalia]
MNLRRSAREALRTQRERLKRLNQTAPPEPFSKWYKEDRKRHPDIPAASFDSQLCIICLEIITGKDSVRALSCRHIYHTACFDKWFKGYHDFCPVCHGRVVPEAESVTV